MNILIFSAIYPAPAEYGIPNDTKVVHYYAKKWQKSGHNIQVVYLHVMPVKRIFKKNNIKKCTGFESDYVFDGINVHLLEYQLLIPKANYLLGLQAKNAEKRISEFVESVFVPDKVFVHFPCSFKGIKSVSGFDCPTMAVLHNIDINILKKKRSLAGELDRYKNIGGRNKNICNIVSELLSRECGTVLSGIDEALIPSGDFIEKKSASLPKKIKLVYAGNLIRLKKVDVIIKALQNVSFEYQFDIIGDGPEKEKLMAMADGNPAISFKGRLSREETVEEMRGADVFVMVSSPETFGLVYVEAMAQGCITVGSRNEGIDGVIEDGKNGFLVLPGNAEELTCCLDKIAAMDPEQRKNLIYSAYNDAAGMTDSAMAEKYFKINV